MQSQHAHAALFRKHTAFMQDRVQRLAVAYQRWPSSRRTTSKYTRIFWPVVTSARAESCSYSALASGASDATRSASNHRRVTYDRQLAEVQGKAAVVNEPSHWTHRK